MALLVARDVLISGNRPKVSQKGGISEDLSTWYRKTRVVDNIPVKCDLLALSVVNVSISLSEPIYFKDWTRLPTAKILPY